MDSESIRNEIRNLLKDLSKEEIIGVLENIEKEIKRRETKNVK